MQKFLFNFMRVTSLYGTYYTEIKRKIQFDKSCLPLCDILYMEKKENLTILTIKNVNSRSNNNRRRSCIRPMKIITMVCSMFLLKGASNFVFGMIILYFKWSNYSLSKIGCLYSKPLISNKM